MEDPLARSGAKAVRLLGPLVVATCREWPEPSRSDALYIDALRARGVAVRHAPWNADPGPFLAAGVVILRSTWDYHHDLPGFRRWLSLLDAAGVPLWNPPALVRWNLDKRYLLELGQAGIPIPQSVVLDTPSSDAVTEVMQARGWEEAVLKPAWGASGFGVRLVRLSEVPDAPFDLEAPGRPVIVQEYLGEVAAHGEVALVYFGGGFSHAVLKQPAAGEFRVNSQYGGSVSVIAAPEELRSAGERVIAALPSVPLYARIDGVLRDGEFVVMEVELHEPGLWLHLAEGASERFADATLAALATTHANKTAPDAAQTAREAPR